MITILVVAALLLARKLLYSRPHVLLFIATRISISANHLRSNSSSENLVAAIRARRRTASGSGSESAFSKPSANSVSVVAWNPMVRLG